MCSLCEIVIVKLFKHLGFKLFFSLKDNFHNNIYSDHLED